EVKTAVYVLHPALLAANLLMMAMLARRVGNGSWLAAVICAAASALSVEVLAGHAMLISEPLFITLMLSGLLLLERAVRKQKLPMLIVSALLLGLAWLTRYAGVGVIAAAGGFMLWSWRGALKRRLIAAALFGVVSALPMFLWLGWGYLQTRSVANRTFQWRPVSTETLQTGYQTLGHWLLPYDTFAGPHLAIAAIIHAILIIGAMVWLLPGKGVDRAKSRRTGMLLMLVGVGYLSGLLFSLAYVDSYTPLDRRTLLPAQALILPILCGAFVSMIARAPVPLSRRVPIAAAAIIVLLLRLPPAAEWVQSATQSQLGYTSTVWRQSPVMKAAQALPGSWYIYSNKIDAVYACTGRNGSPLPRKFNPTDRQPFTRLTTHLKRMRSVSESKTLVIVLIYRRGLDHIVGPTELSPYFRMKTIGNFPDGRILRLVPRPALPDDVPNPATVPSAGENAGEDQNALERN
ncbi:MAG TPA: hypothetical protein VGB55_05780, partial [Tepidisphaeraceae bacterium]